MIPGKRYLVIGGRIRSKKDGQEHYVNAKTLCQLYDIDPRLCILAEENNPRSLKGIQMEGLIVLRPLFHGAYREYLDEIS